MIKKLQPTTKKWIPLDEIADKLNEVIDLINTLTADREGGEDKIAIYNSAIKDAIVALRVLLLGRYSSDICTAIESANKLLKKQIMQGEISMIKKCPTCKNEYDDGGNSWKKNCYDCYKNYRSWKRIEKFGFKSDIYITHPSVTKEELDEFIKKNKHEVGWGAVEIDFDKWKKFKFWSNSTNYD